MVADEICDGHLHDISVPINIIALIFASVTSVFFVFPPFIPVTSGTSMNWVIVVVAIVVFMAVVNWFTDARKTYHGPVNVDHLMEAAARAAQLADNLKNR